MKNTEPDNPFLLSAYGGPELFCNREKEVNLLINLASNGNNIILIALRRMGKTGLLHHTIHRLEMEKKGTGIYVDIYDTESFRDFTNSFATAILQAFPEKSPLWKKVMDFIKQLRPVISYDDFTGQPQLSLDYARPAQYEQSLQSLLEFLESQNQLIVVAIDEFQQITNYPEKNVEAILRKHIQRLKNVKFIFSGSSPHLLAEMFQQAKRPFFASASAIELLEIDAEDYAAFIHHHFETRNQKISNEAIEYILRFTRRHTFYTQSLCNRIFQERRTTIDVGAAQNAAYRLLIETESIFFQYRSLLTHNQWNMLRAIAKEDQMYMPNSREMIARHGLGSPSVVQRSLESLLQKEMVYTRESEDGKYYSVYDCFLSRWLEWK